MGVREIELTWAYTDFLLSNAHFLGVFEKLISYMGI